MNKQTYPEPNAIEQQQQFISERSFDGFQDLDQNLDQRNQQLLNENRILRDEKQTMEQRLLNENRTLRDENQTLCNENQRLHRQLSKDIFSLD